METVFAAWSVLLIIGILLVVTASALLIVRRVMRRKNKENKYKISLAAGVGMLVPGIVLVVITALTALSLFGYSKAMDSKMDREWHYYKGDKDIEDFIDLEEKLTYNGALSYPNEKITLDGVTYVETGMEWLKYNDPNRAGLKFGVRDNERKTFGVFDYKSPSGCDLISIGRFIYCPEEQVDILADYYHNCGFTYVESYNTRAFMPVDFPDDVFLRLFTADPTCTDRGGRDGQSVDTFRIRQTSEDGMMVREIYIEYTEDGDVNVGLQRSPIEKYPFEFEKACELSVIDEDIIKILDKYNNGDIYD